MGADNWRICPRCKAKAEADQDVKVKRAQESYGKVPADTYAQLLREAEAEPKLEETFREDYEIGMGESGEFYVTYRGNCTVCGFSHDFNHESSGHK
jgi:hypothetical protein